MTGEEMGEERIVARLRATGVVPIVRVGHTAHALTLGADLVGAGLDVIEVSFNTPDAPAVIERLAGDHPGLLVGAGTVLRAAEAERAVRAGARFLLSPAFDREVDRAARDLGCLYIPGAFTATEVWAVLQSGRTLFKLFPAALAGIAGMRALLEPFGRVDVLPTGGIGVADVAAWRAAGVVAVGLGGAITKAEDPAAAARAALAAAKTVAA
jgi:2-dehydro-3-deoxyphosphogluconate aldolase/(4S)-4-hydroxy-2-oxoglutarate aldolase